MCVYTPVRRRIAHPRLGVLRRRGSGRLTRGAMAAWGRGISSITPSHIVPHTTYHNHLAWLEHVLFCACITVFA